MQETQDRMGDWKQLCREQGWLQGETLVAPEGHQLYFSFIGVYNTLGGEGNGAPGFFISSDITRTSIKNPPCGATDAGQFIVAKPAKGYNVSIWTYYLWEDLVNIQLVKIDADRVV